MEARHPSKYAAFYRARAADLRERAAFLTASGGGLKQTRVIVMECLADECDKLAAAWEKEIGE